MILALSLVVGALFGSGVHLLLQRDLLRNVVGILLLSHAGHLFLMSVAQSYGRPPIATHEAPLEAAANVSDPVVQALTLTALVITFGFTTFVLRLMHSTYTSVRSLDREHLLREPEEGRR